MIHHFTECQPYPWCVYGPTKIILEKVATKFSLESESPDTEIVADVVEVINNEWVLIAFHRELIRISLFGKAAFSDAIVNLEKYAPLRRIIQWTHDHESKDASRTP